MTMPTFLILGGKKCGTSALFRILGQHPEICLPAQKEVHFFTHEGTPPPHPYPHIITELASYQALFADCRSAPATGEASPTYLHVPKAAERIHHYLPEAKLIAVLRHPVERMYSDYLHERQAGRETEADFGAALTVDAKSQYFGYRMKSQYSGHLQRYYGLFPSAQIHACVYEDFASDPVPFLQAIFSFLQVDSSFVPDTSVRSKGTGVPRSTLVQLLASDRNPAKALARRVLPESVYRKYGYAVLNRNTVKPQIDPDLRQGLLEELRPEVDAVAEMLGRDLSQWLS